MKNLLIDSKEPQSIISQFSDAKVKSLGKNSGDLFAHLENGIMIVERKETSDLCGSIADGRLFAQCENIATLARFAFLVIDGKLYYQDGKLMSTRQGFGFTQTGWTQASIEAALVKVQMLGVIVVRDFLGEESYADCIKSLITMCERVDKPHTTHKARCLNSPNETQQDKLDFLASFSHIGAERAINLLDTFPDKSLAELIDWMQYPNETKVPLWGTGTHQHIRKFLGTKTKGE